MKITARSQKQQKSVRTRTETFSYNGHPHACAQEQTKRSIELLDVINITGNSTSKMFKNLIATVDSCHKVWREREMGKDMQRFLTTTDVVVHGRYVKPARMTGTFFIFTFATVLEPCCHSWPVRKLHGVKGTECL